MTDVRAAFPLALVVCALAAAPALAQRTASRTSGPRLTGNVYGGYDAPLFATSSFATLQPSSQTFSGADANLDVARPGRKVALALTANASTRYFPKFTPKFQPSYGVGLTLSSVTQGRWLWSLSNFAHYAPISATSLFAGSTAVDGQAFTLANATAFQVSTTRQVDMYSTGMLEYSPSRRLHLQMLGMAGTVLPIDAQIADNVRLNGRARVAYDVTRNFRGFAGYGVSQNRVAAYRGTPASTYTIDSFDFGIDFGRPFRITRNTTLGLQTGLVKVPEQGIKTFQLTGSASLNHQFRRSWNASLTAQRDARFVQSFKDPVVYAGGSIGAGGTIAGNLGASIGANYSKGTINAPTAKSSFTSYSASTQLRYNVRRLVATFIDYSLFRSEFDASTALVGYPSGEFGRYSIRFGLSFGVSPFR